MKHDAILIAPRNAIASSVLLPSAHRRSRLTVANLRELSWLFLKFVPVFPLALRYKD